MIVMLELRPVDVNVQSTWRLLAFACMAGFMPSVHALVRTAPAGPAMKDMLAASAAAARPVRILRRRIHPP